MFKICQHHVSSRANIENRGMQKNINMKRVIHTGGEEISKQFKIVADKIILVML